MTTLEVLFGSKLRARVLAWLFTHADERYFVRQLTGLLGEDSTNVSRELARLERTGILLSTTEGRQRYYQANRGSPLFQELHGLMVKTAGVTDVLRSALAPAAKRISVSFVFGSVASGREARRSDIDVMVIGEITFGEVVSLLHEAEVRLGREVNPVVYPNPEFRRKAREDHYFVTNVLGADKVFLTGDEDELAKLAGKRVAESA